LKDHLLWTYPVHTKVPPRDTSVEDHFIERPDGMFEMRQPGPDWVDTIVPMGHLYECLDVEYVYVDPTTEHIEDEDSRNTTFRVWLEAGGWFDNSKDPNLTPPPEGWDDYSRWSRSHDLKLDCGGPDLESALLELALRVKFYYCEDGTDREGVPRQCEFERIEGDDYISTCVDAGDGYCKTCGYPVTGDIPISAILKGRIEDIDKHKVPEEENA